ncbi:MAG: diguanylate cyclase with sensor, partial [Anaerospora sp.]|nr:diguanylate cyclase with sensor [Anaerospora sp.]
AAGIPESEITGIQLFAEFHDVGKIGIPDHILNKQGTLNDEERLEIQRHCEIGYRIAQASTDLLPISDWILKHHEWWNGAGYPLGLVGEQIPFAVGEDFLQSVSRQIIR